MWQSAGLGATGAGLGSAGGVGGPFDVLVKATNPGTWAFHCHILPHAESEHGMFGMVTAVIVS